jgi:polysaccharide export outer membrane protein
MRSVAAAAAVVLIAASAVLAQTPVPNPPAVPPTAAQAEDSSYLLDAGDTIEIKFMSNPELNERVQIRPDGRISMPLVGELHVARTTIAALTATLARAYADILRTPAVTIQVREFANRRIFVGGEVNRPGMLPMGGRQTALGAVMEAGSFRPTAARDAVLVIRRGEKDTPQLLRLSTKSKNGQAAAAANFVLEPLDIVLVTESGVARTNRAIDQYVRQMIPISLTGGFSWLLGRGVLGTIQ